MNYEMVETLMKFEWSEKTLKIKTCSPETLKKWISFVKPMNGVVHINLIRKQSQLWKLHEATNIDTRLINLRNLSFNDNRE